MAISATLAQQCVGAALQGGDFPVSMWFTNASAGQQAAGALAACNFLSLKQQLGVVMAHAAGSATPVTPSGQNLGSLLGLIGALNAAFLAQAANAANNSQAFDLVNNLVTYVK
jgi:hypothetical protein